MITDSKLYFDGPTGVAITASKLSTNTLDLEKIEDLGKGSPIYINCYINQAFTSSANKLTIKLVASSGANPGNTDQVLELKAATAESALGSTGKLFRMALPEDIPAYDGNSRLGVYYLATTALTGGKVVTFLTIGSGND